MRKFSGSEKMAFAVSSVMFVLFLCAAVLAAMLLGMLDETESDFSSYRAEAEIKLSELEKAKNRVQASFSALNNELELAEKTRNELETRIAQTEAEIAKLQHSFENKDELYSELNAKLSALRTQLEQKELEIISLKENINELEKVYGLDINRQYELLKTLETWLRESAPMNRIETPAISSDGSLILDENGAPVIEVSYVYPKISVYYEDVHRGYRYAWQSEEVYALAGCAQAPFALSILKAASEEQAAYDKKLAEYISQNGVVDALPGYTWQYDFSKIFTYTEEKYRPGSGTIKDQEFGVQYSHRDLFGLLLSNGDTVAFAELKAEYGTTLTQQLAKDLGLSVIRNNAERSTAAELGVIMKEICRFTESGATYASFMKKHMIESVHTVMIGYGVSPKKVAHMHGWDTDAYHDMAIVYDDHPYVLVIMTDMDQGGEAVNTFVQKLAAMIDDLHETFYAK